MTRNQPSREKMLQWINMVSFAVNDVTLYLDTHPTDQCALNYFDKYSRLRNQALEDYASMYGPLTIDTARTCEQMWEWVNRPWPWELEGGC